MSTSYFPFFFLYSNKESSGIELLVFSLLPNKILSLAGIYPGFFHMNMNLYF
jgi:hypothetical protein